MSDPKGLAGAKKIPMCCIPPAVELEMGAAMAEGGIKYGAHNWRNSGGVCATTYVAAARRHLIAWMMGEDLDPHSGGGISHLTKAMASLAVLRDAQMHGEMIDNRPPPSPPEMIDQITAAYLDMLPVAAAAVADADIEIDFDFDMEDK